MRTLPEVKQMVLALKARKLELIKETEQVDTQLAYSIGVLEILNEIEAKPNSETAKPPA